MSERDHERQVETEQCNPKEGLTSLSSDLAYCAFELSL